MHADKSEAILLLITACYALFIVGYVDIWIQWNGMVDQNGGMNWNGGMVEWNGS